MGTVIEAHDAQDREVATIRPPEEPAPRCRNVRFGTMKDEIILKPGWDDPMTEEELAEWYDAPLSSESDKH